LLDIYNNKNMTNPFQTIDDRLSNIENLLLTIKHNPPTQQIDEADQFLTIQQAGEFLNLSVPTLYGFTQRAEIPVCKRGKRLYFSKKSLTDWIKQGRKKTIAETVIEANSFMGKKKGAQQ
jgi:excisionase family DNA binding protein